MTTIKKIWAFLKTHWYIPVIIIVAIVLGSKNNRLLKIIDAQKESYDKQKAAIENAEKEKQEAKSRINKEYEKAAQKIEEEYAKMNKEISNRQKSIIKKTVKKFHSDPDALAKELSEKFGVQYVPNKNN
jgi:predicted Holliday junction resolvase-like endonuclease